MPGVIIICRIPLTARVKSQVAGQVKAIGYNAPKFLDDKNTLQLQSIRLISRS